MFARVTKLQVNPAVQDDALKGYEEKVVPTVKSKKGFRGLYVLTNRKTGTWLTIGLWDSEADALADEQGGHYKERVNMGAEIFTAPPVVEGYDVSILL
jgi:heme-degrading monooxygenase HmoA